MTFYHIRLTLARMAFGMPAKALAKTMELSKQQLSHIETGARNPKRSELLRLCEIFGVTEGFFCEENSHVLLHKHSIIIHNE